MDHISPPVHRRPSKRLLPPFFLLIREITKSYLLKIETVWPKTLVALAVRAREMMLDLLSIMSRPGASSYEPHSQLRMNL